MMSNCSEIVAVWSLTLCL